MGSSNSTIVVQIDSQVMAGCAVHGRIYLQLGEEVSASALQLEVFGQERTCVHYTRTHSTGSGKNRQTHTTHHYARAHRSLLSISVPIANFPGGKAGPGQFEFPFTFTLPAGLPTTMHVAGSSNCSVSYVVRARMVKPQWYKMDLKAARPLLVSMAPRPLNPAPVITPPCTSPINFCCCCSRGAMTLACAIDAPTATRGDALGVGIACKNESTQPIGTAAITITERIHWRAQGHHASRARHVALASFAGDTLIGAAKLAKEELKELKAASEQSDALHVVRPPLHTVPHTVFRSVPPHRQVRDQLLAGSNRSTLNLDPTTRDSYAGGLLQVSHHLSCALKTPCCVTDPTVQLPFVVQPRLQAA